MKLKLFEEFRDIIEEENYLIILIDDEGTEHPMSGKYEEGVGIFDQSGKSWPAGVKPDGTVMVCASKEFGALKSNDLEFIPGLENCLTPGYNYFEGYPEKISEKYEFGYLSGKELDEAKSALELALDFIKIEVLDHIEYDMKSNKIKFKDGFKNIDINDLMSKLNDEFGEDIVRELNVEALLRKIAQLIALKKRSTRRRVKEEFLAYIGSIESRIKRQQDASTEEDHFDKVEGERSILPRKKYEGEKYDLQIELMKLQEWVVKNKKRVAIVFEGRDAAGKGSTIKRFVEYLNPRYFRVAALGIPTEEEKNNWLGRYEKHLPKPGELVFFDRSWYNRGVVEPAMGYCTEEQYNDFMETVVGWEENLIREGLILIKFWFSITKEKQQFRFKMRQDSPLKYWKFSPNDSKVIDKFEIIGEFKNKMFIQTSSRNTPWVIVNSNDKKVGRLNAIRYVLDKVDYDGKDETKCEWYPEVINIIT